MSTVTDPVGPPTHLNPREADPKRWAALAVIAVAQLMVVLDASIVTIALPSAQKSLHISTDNRQWMVTAYTLAFGGLLLLGGRIADYVGRKRMFIIGLLGFAGASALGGAAVNAPMRQQIPGQQHRAYGRTQPDRARARRVVRFLGWSTRVARLPGRGRRTLRLLVLRPSRGWQPVAVVLELGDRGRRVQRRYRSVRRAGATGTPVVAGRPVRHRGGHQLRLHRGVHQGGLQLRGG